MPTILVPTDLRPDTDIALSVAADIARQNGASLVLMHSVVQPMRPLVYTGTISTAPDDVVRRYYDARAEAEKAMASLVSAEKYSDVSIAQVLVENGEGLIEEVTTRQADLIVMHTRGSSGWEQYLLGSNAEDIVRHATCPVLVVREPVARFRPDRAVLALDLDERMKTHYEFPFALGNAMAPQYLYVMTPTNSRVPDGVRSWVQSFAAARGIKNYELAIRESGSVPEGIAQYAEEIGADLVVLFTHGHKGLQRLFSGSVAEDVLNHSKVPVLVMRL
jgi:nucleotide-binding universal stress UspA family protein